MSCSFSDFTLAHDVPQVSGERIRLVRKVERGCAFFRIKNGTNVLMQVTVKAAGDEERAKELGDELVGRFIAGHVCPLRIRLQRTRTPCNGYIIPLKGVSLLRRPFPLPLPQPQQPPTSWSDSESARSMSPSAPLEILWDRV